MRRLFAFLMCVSGFSLTVTYTHAEEPAATPIAEPADAAAPPEFTSPQTDAPESSPAATDPVAEARHELDEMMRRWRELYRQVAGDEELRVEVKENIEQLARLYGESRRLAETYTGAALEQARAALDEQIDQLERSLAENRERREAMVRPSMKEMMDTERRLMALRSAIANLKLARFEEQAAALEPELKKLEVQSQRHRELLQAAKEAADVDLRKSQPRLYIEQRREAGAFAEVRELSAEVHELRRELRRLRAEVEALQQQHAPPADREHPG